MKRVMICVLFVDREGNGQGQLLGPDELFSKEIEEAIREGVIGSAEEAADFVADLLNIGSKSGAE